MKRRRNITRILAATATRAVLGAPGAAGAEAGVPQRRGIGNGNGLAGEKRDLEETGETVAPAPPEAGVKTGQAEMREGNLPLDPVQGLIRGQGGQMTVMGTDTETSGPASGEKDQMGGKRHALAERHLAAKAYCLAQTGRPVDTAAFVMEIGAASGTEPGTILLQTGRTEVEDGEGGNSNQLVGKYKCGELIDSLLHVTMRGGKDIVVGNGSSGKLC